MTIQLTSSKEHWGIGGTNLNCRLAIGEQIIMPIVNRLHNNGKMTDYNYKWFVDNNNSASSFSVLDTYIDKWEGKQENIDILIDGKTVTRQGTLIGIASGVSKTALIFEVKKQGKPVERFVIKYSKTKVDVDDLRTFVFKADKEALKRIASQLQEQYSRYINAVKNDDKELLSVILPCHKVFDRYNAVLEPYAEHVNTLESVCRKTGQDEDEIYRILREHNIHDIRHHSGNSGIYQGRAVVIDYGL